MKRFYTHPIIFIWLVFNHISPLSAHSIIKDKCSWQNIYSFDADNFIPDKIIQLETANHRVQISHSRSSSGWPLHKLHIVAKEGSHLSLIQQFEGPVFEIDTAEMDRTADGLEFLITDKPSARGYRYSLLPSSTLPADTNGLAEIFEASSKKRRADLWSLPESLYPIITDVNADGQCEILDFNEAHNTYFTYPAFYVTAKAYRFYADEGMLKEDTALTNQFVKTQYNDLLYQANSIINLIQNARTTMDSVTGMAEKNLNDLAAIKFLYAAKQTGHFSDAVQKLQNIAISFSNLSTQDEAAAPPYYFFATGQTDFADLLELNRQASLFTSSQMTTIQKAFFPAEKPKKKQL